MENRITLSIAYNKDCLDFMRSCKDKQFYLIVADPPYGIGFSAYERGSGGKDLKERYTKRKKEKWDDGIPTDEYFIEMKRISHHQIVWGGNYFPYLAGKETPNLKSLEDFKQYIEESDQNWILWHKKNPVPNFAYGELAWSSFGYNDDIDYMYYGNINSEPDRIHPTQKPIALYLKLFKKYAPNGCTILDPYLGSGSSRCAAYFLGIDFIGIEKSGDIFVKQEKRFERRKSTVSLFAETQPKKTFNLDD